jgi:flagellar protein FlgJ
MDNLAHANAATDISRFTGLRAAARRDPDAAFATVAKEFEALFIQLMLKAAREASPEGGLFDSRELKMYREMMDDQIALAMAEQGGLGFEAVLRQQFSLDPELPAERELQVPERRYFPPALFNSTALVSPFDAVSPPESTGGHSARKVEFIDTVRPLARAAAAELGLDADILVAQAALETGWGRHTITDRAGSSTFNYFGIKAGGSWNGAAVDVPTLEFINGRPVKINARFRAYPNSEAAFEDYVAFVSEQPRYAPALRHGGDPAKYIIGLADAGYATDPRYAEKILAIAKQMNPASTIARR